MPARSLTAREIERVHEQAPMVVDASAQDARTQTASFFKRISQSPSALAEWADEREFQRGEVIFEEGEAGDALYLIISGLAAVVTGRIEALRLIALRGPGEIVGEMALVENRPRMATVAALESARVLRISRESFHKLLRLDQEFGLELMRILSGRLRAEARRQASKAPIGEIRDPLTGVFSRAILDERLSETTEQARRYGRPFSILLADLDHFKSVNDGYGHARGDEVLREFARRARAAVRESDLIFRFGGDEFCFLLPETGGDQAAALARRILDAVREQPFLGTPPLALSLCVGVAAYPEDAALATSIPETLLGIADRRVYEAKRAGRGRVIGAGGPEAADGAEAADAESPVRDFSRLIERDAALDEARRFFEILREERRAGLRVRGPAGCGHSRFLREVAERARLLNYAVLWLTGESSLRSTPFGAVSAAREAGMAAREAGDESAFPWPSQDGSVSALEALEKALASFVSEGRRNGALFALDDACLLDAATLGIVQRALEGASSFPIGLAYAKSEVSLVGDRFPQVEVELEPLSELGAQIWLRHSLRWEAPPGFAALLRSETGGLPAAMRRKVCALIDEGDIALTADGWMLAAESFEKGGAP